MKNMPMPVKVALETALTSKGVSKAKKAIIQEVLDDKAQFRFAAMPDEARQVVREACLKDEKAGTFVSMTACAVAYGCTAPNLKKWKDEVRKGITTIRSRGRKLGTKNQFRHMIDKHGNPITIPFVPITKRSRSAKPVIGRGSPRRVSVG